MSDQNPKVVQEIINIHIDEIFIPKKKETDFHQRDRSTSDQDVIDLAHAIKTKGLLQLPTVTLANPEETTLPYAVTDGSGRLTAFRYMVEQGEHDGIINVVLSNEKIEGIERLMRQVLANGAVERVNDKDYINSLIIIMRETGKGYDELSEITGFSQKHLRDMLKTVRLPEELRDDIQDGTLSLTNGILLSQVQGKMEEDAFNKMAEVAKTTTTTKFAEEVNDFTTDYNERMKAERKGQVAEFTPKAKLLKKIDLENMLVDAESTFEEDATEFNEGYLHALKKIFQMDPNSIAAQKAEYEQKKVDRENAKEAKKKAREADETQSMIDALEAKGIHIQKDMEA